MQYYHDFKQHFRCLCILRWLELSENRKKLATFKLSLMHGVLPVGRKAICATWLIHPRQPAVRTSSPITKSLSPPTNYHMNFHHQEFSVPSELLNTFLHTAPNVPYISTIWRWQLQLKYTCTTICEITTNTMIHMLIEATILSETSRGDTWNWRQIKILIH